MPATETAALVIPADATARAERAGAWLVPMEPQPVGSLEGLVTAAVPAEAACVGTYCFADSDTGEGNYHRPPYAPGDVVTLELAAVCPGCGWTGWMADLVEESACPGCAADLLDYLPPPLRRVVRECRPVPVPGGLSSRDLHALGYPCLLAGEPPLAAASLRADWYATHPGQAHAWLVTWEPVP